MGQELTLYPATVAGIADALHALGVTPRDIAEHLIAGEHHGAPRSTRHCVIAEYLRAVIPDAGEVSVCGQDVHIWTGGASTGEPSTIEHELAFPVRRFIDGFDRGRYPELVDPVFRYTVDPAGVDCEHDIIATEEYP